MAFSLYQASVPVFTQMLTGLSGVLDKAAAYVQERKIDQAALLNDRLFSNMYTLCRQVQVASDWAKNTSARLAGVEPPQFADDEKSFEELKGRVGRTLDFLKGLDRAAIDAAAEKDIVFPAGPSKRKMAGADFLLHQTMPHFFFHVTTAYDILRTNGIDLTKRDYMGPVPRVTTL
jgi:uncharacterized protein